MAQRSNRRSRRIRNTKRLSLERLEDRIVLNGDYGFAVSFGQPGQDRGHAVATDSAGNVYATGHYNGTVDFDPGPGTFSLSSNNNSLDIFVTKFNSSGGLVWARSLGGPSNAEQGLGIAVDAAGNVHTAGFFDGTSDFDPGAGTFNLTSAGGGGDVFVSKLDSAGNLVWARGMGGGSTDLAEAITVDAAGNVLTTGQYGVSSGGSADFDPGPGVFNLTSAGGGDIFVSKLDSGGNFAWAKSMGGSALSNTTGEGIGVDASGNVYTAGYFGGTVDFDPGPGTFNLSPAQGGFDEDSFVSKLDSAGNFLWARSLDANRAFDMAIDAAGNVHTIGEFIGTRDFDPGPGTFDMTATGPSFKSGYISKLNAVGDFVWAKKLELTFAAGIDLDSASNVYTTGGYFGAADFDPGPGTFLLPNSGTVDVFVSKLDSAGDFAFARSLGGASHDQGLGIAVNDLGHIYTTGTFSGTADFDPGLGTANRTSVGLNDVFISQLTQQVTPPPPSTPDLDVGSDTGSSDTDNLTNDTAPTFSGTSVAGATIELFAGAVSLATATANGSGTWSVTSSPLADGVHSITATATLAGLTSGASSALVITIDATVPAIPTTLDLDPGSDSGAADNDDITSDNTPTIGGDADAGTTIQLSSNINGNIGSGTASSPWSITTSALDDGTHNITAVAVDPAGNVSAASAALVVTVDTAAPAGPVGLDLSVASDTGAADDDEVTSDNTPTINGTAEAGSTVTLSSDVSGVVGTATADGSGNWSIGSAVLSDGVHLLTAIATDVAGNASSSSASLPVSIDTAAPTTPTIGSPTTGSTTSDTTPTFTGSGEPGTAVTLLEGSTVLGITTVDGSGNWSVTSAALSDGLHALLVRTTDTAGNTTDSAVVELTVQTSVTTGVQLNGGVLQVIGSSDRDVVKIQHRGTQLQVRARFGNGTHEDQAFATVDVQSIQATLGDGNDFFYISHQVDVPAAIDGGGGRDLIFAGGGDDLIRGGSGRDHIFARAGNDIVLGEDGDDALFGGAGGDLLIGGTGRDWGFGGRSDDLLIGGTTDHDLDDGVLHSLRDEWSSPNSFAVRVANLRSGGGLNGTNRLNVATVHADGAPDRLFGGLFGQDWFWAESTDSVFDGFGDLEDTDDT